MTNPYPLRPDVNQKAWRGGLTANPDFEITGIIDNGDEWSSTRGNVGQDRADDVSESATEYLR